MPAWSPNGRRIAFVRGGVDDDEPTDLWVMRADGSRRRAITHGPERDIYPDW
jgi:TolB protein